jgi:hypothetical protein
LKVLTKKDIPLNAGIVFGSLVVLKQLDNPMVQAVEVVALFVFLVLFHCFKLSRSA